MEQTIPKLDQDCDHNNQNPKSGNGHILVIPFPLQGHVAPMMKLSHHITKLGSKVTFLTTNARMTDASMQPNWNQGIRMISIGQVLEYNQDEWEDHKKVHDTIQRVMPSFLENLLKESQESGGGDGISGVILDSPMAWMVDTLKRMGIRVAVFWCSTMGCLALALDIPRLLRSRFIDDDGTPSKNEAIKLLPNMPPMAPNDLLWHFPSDFNMQKSIFHFTKGIIHHIQKADWILCNWFHQLDPKAHSIAPNTLSIGPLLAHSQSSGSFYSEDSTCLTWLDKHPEGSVVYVAFGSTSKFSNEQLEELIFGLKLMGRPFLWVARSAYAQCTSDCVGKVVEWAPQEAVLGHKSIGCFVTHCGWSSFMEGLSNGVPMVCWPYFGDQLYAKTCICEGWKVGKWLKGDNESGIVSRLEIKKMVDEVMCDVIVKENALRFKEMATNSIKKGGSSLANLQYLVDQMKH